MKRKGEHNIVDMNSINTDGISLCKRPRYDNDPNIQKENLEQWSLNQNVLILDAVFDNGVRPLQNEEIITSDDEKQWNNSNTDLIDVSCSSLSPESLKKQISLLESTLMKETLQKLSSGDWDALVSSSKSKHNKINKTNYFEQLSDEVILHIFHWIPKAHLHNVALVCKRFHELTQDKCLWTRMDISGRNLGKGCLGHILSRQVMILRLAQSEIAYPPILPGVKASSPDFNARLLYLDLSMTDISKESLTELFNKCSRLKKLSLEHVSLDDNVMEALSKSKEIEVINFAMAEGITETGLRFLLEKCRKIRELNISWTYLSAPSIKYLCQNLPSMIDRLNFSGCLKYMSDQHVAALVKTCPELHELDLSDCTGLTGQAVEHIALLKNLTFLALSRCYAIRHRSFVPLKTLKTLTYLDIHGDYIVGGDLQFVKETLGSQVHINKFKFSSVARPTVGPRRSSIWGLRVRD